MLISRLPNPNILQQSEPNGLKLWIITVNWGIKMLDFCQILKWPVSKSYWKLVLFFENNDIFSFILYHHASNAGVDLWRCVDTQISTAVVTHCHINRDLKCWDDVCPSRCSTLMSGSSYTLHSWCLVMVTHAGAGAGGGHLAPELIPA